MSIKMIQKKNQKKKKLLKKEIVKQPNPQMRSMENKRASMIKFKNPLDVFI